jgi:predicted sulfurtransferase
MRRLVDRTVRVLALLASVGLVASGPVRAQQLPPDGVLRITQQEFRKLVTANNAVIVDTRPGDVYRSGHIPGAVSLPLEGLTTFPPGFDKLVESFKTANKPVVTYCA